MKSTLGKRITANRKRLALTQDQLAEKLGITAQAVSKWENDLNCPDISMLPKLADIFGISIDELLGREIPVTVCETEVVPKENENGFVYNNGQVDLHWDGIKLEGVGLACWVLLTGIVYLLTQLLHIQLSFWDILWPTFLLVLGLFGLYPKFSVFRLGCALVGGYYLLDKLQILSVDLENGIILAVMILLIGISLLVDALRKNKRKETVGLHGKICNDYIMDGNHFSYDASFGSATQRVEMEKLQSGQISTNFGEYTLDLTGICALEQGCRLHADCSFGELTILVPHCFPVIADSSTSFASFEVKGQPDNPGNGIIALHTDVSFGCITIEYV